MRFTSIVLAAGLLAAPAIAFAQSSPSPKNTTEPGMTATQAPTNMGASSTSGDRMGKPASATSERKMKKGHMATGKSKMTSGSAMSESKKKNASPASGAEGAAKEK